MKKTFIVIALLSLVGSLVLVGCKEKQTPPPPPEMPSTNAPAPPAPAQ